ncbi:hypothetical protein [Nostoc commune]|uniref:hypothetical protein n=1 Tax=Nostoc commune TaxID=1178 RepID=UPI00207483AE|nr:hypothetical protein [Nostoc commune]
MISGSFSKSLLLVEQTASRCCTTTSHDRKHAEEQLRRAAEMDAFRVKLYGCTAIAFRPC